MLTTIAEIARIVMTITRPETVGIYFELATADTPMLLVKSTATRTMLLAFPCTVNGMVKVNSLPNVLDAELPNQVANAEDSGTVMVD